MKIIVDPMAKAEVEAITPLQRELMASFFKRLISGNDLKDDILRQDGYPDVFRWKPAKEARMLSEDANFRVLYRLGRYSITILCVGPRSTVYDVWRQRRRQYTK